MSDSHGIPSPRATARLRRRRRGFTLIEAALTTVIVGTGVLSILAAQQAYHRKNMWAQRVGVAALLANELRELTMTLPRHDPISGAATLGPEADETTVASYDDLDDFAGVVAEDGFGAGTVISPPINALRQTIDGMDGWTQVVEVANVLPGYISAASTLPLGTSDLYRVRVSVLYQGPNDAEAQTITQLTWLVGP